MTKNVNMENSQNSNEEPQLLHSPSPPPRRRRSTFFIRRESLVPLIQVENIETNASQERDKKEQTTKQNEVLERYYAQLLSEKDQWKKEVNNRRHKYHDLRQQYQLMAQAPSSSMSYTSLTNEDIEFLKGKPNISKLVELQNNLHKSVEMTKEGFRKTVELDNILISHVERKLNKITDHILENSTVDLID